MMTDAQQRKAAREFARYWKDKGYEKGQSQPYWLSLLRDVLSIEHPEQFISFEDQVHLDHTSFIDGIISATHVMIEQKGCDKRLDAPIRQSDGTLLTPFQQAKRYSAELPYSQRPRWIVTCNFQTMYVYDMEKPGGDPEIIELADLERDYYRLSFLVDSENEHLKREMAVSLAAGEIVGKLYDAFRAQYVNPDSDQTMRSLNVLCVRLVFCLFAEDAGIFGRHDMFHDYMASFRTPHMRNALIELFDVLNIPTDQRDPYLDPALAAFPYVSGGLFAEGRIEIPQFTEEIRQLLLGNASEDFNWAEISPTIFGAVFESTLNPETRRSSGMHYTSVENIHKVIDPLFLDDLRIELNGIKETVAIRTRKKRAAEFQTKLASLIFLDPACGSGNFLTETYLSLRRLENEALRILYDGQMTLGDTDPIKVSITQFYGIEINDFAVTVAQTALWIAESQMMTETEEIVYSHLEFLPLRTNAHIVEGNALRIDWNDVVPRGKLSYIMGNPPFVGYSLQSKEQKADILSVYVDEKGKPYKTAGKIDYVSGWYFKAAQLMTGTHIRTAFVSTNSITQGEQVASVWKPLYDRFGIHIDFAHRTFIWDSEASIKAHVHCVIVGFSVAPNTAPKRLYDNDRWQNVDNINAYLTSSGDIFLTSRTQPISDVPQMLSGNRPTDGGNLILSAEEREDLLQKEPMAEPYIKNFMMGYEFINRVPRYCLWLVGISPSELRHLPMVTERVARCKEARAASPDAGRRRLADTPTLFREQLNPDSFVVVPKVSSERRRYIPMGYLGKDTIAGDKLFIIPDATIYHFGILMSNVHMAWMRAVCGRLKSDYSYSINIVYNNFPWPTPTQEQRARIEQTARAILDVRELYPDSSLADLYDELTMPPELRRAHQNNDKAVMQAYGWKKGDAAYGSEADCVAALMKMYKELVGKNV